MKELEGYEKCACCTDHLLSNKQLRKENEELKELFANRERLDKLWQELKRRAK